MNSAAPSPAPPGTCPQLSSQDILAEIRKMFAKMCPQGSQSATNDPFCIALNSASDVGDLVRRLKDVDKKTWHTWWSKPPGSDALLGILATAQMLKCLSTKHNSKVLVEVGNLKDWYFDDLLMAVADFDPIKRSGVFTPKDAIKVQTTVNKAFCSGAPQLWMGIIIFVIGILAGVIVTLIIAAATKKR